MAEKKKGIIRSAIGFIVGVIFAALALRSLLVAARRAYRAVRGIGWR